MPDFRLPLVAALLATGLAAAQVPGPAEWHNSRQEAPRASFQLYELLAPRPPVAPPTKPGVSQEGQSGAQLSPTAPPPSAARPARPAIPEPIYLLNARIIISGGILSDINPQDIAQLDVYKGADVPAPLRGLADRGVIGISLKTKPKLATKSLADISRWLKLTGPVAFQLQGQPLMASELRIATEGITGLDVTRAAAGTVVNIRLTPPKPTPPGQYPPGTIFVRGLARS